MGAAEGGILSPLRVLVTGAAGQLGIDLARAFGNGSEPRSGTGRAWDVVALDRRGLDVADRDRVQQVVGTVEPDVVVHAAAWTAVDACEEDPDRAYAVNALGTRHVAEAARRHGAHLVYVSTDYVFDGTLDRPYVEWDRTNPLSVYGRSKLGGEAELDPTATVVRTSWVVGAHGSNMVKTVLRLSAERDQLAFVDDQHGCPTFTADLAAAIRRLAAARLPGVFHVTNQGPTTWFDFVRAIVAAAGRDPAMVRPIATADLDPPRPAPRPANSVLDNAALRLQGLALLPHWEDSLGPVVKELLA